MTVPAPLPRSLTDSVGSLWMRLKVAVTFWLAFKVTTQVELVLQLPPDHPVKEEPLAAVAVSVTEVPGAKLALQACPQLMPEGALVTVPLPLTATVSTGEELKFAVTEVFCVTVMVQAPAPLQAPAQPAKKEFAPAEALRVTCVPLGKLALQVLPQLMPAGVLLMVPPPTPAAWTVSWKEPAPRLELLLPPPQPLRIIRKEAKPQTTTLTLGQGMELPPYVY